MQALWCYVVCMRYCVPDLPSFTAAHHTPLSFPFCGCMNGVLNRTVRDSYDMLKLLFVKFYIQSHEKRTILEMCSSKKMGECSFYQSSTVETVCFSHKW